MGGKGNPPKRWFGDLVPSMRKSMPYIFSITCQEIKMNLTEFDLTKVNSSIILNPGVRKTIVHWLNNLLLGQTYPFWGPICPQYQ